MIVLCTPKGWAGPAEVDGVRMTGTFRSHQVPLSNMRDNPAHLALLEQWLRSYGPDKLFDDAGHPVALVLAANPVGELRMSASPHANGGRLAVDLDLPDHRDYALDVPHPRTAGPSRPGSSDSCYATSTPATRTASACSAPTRRTATGSAPCSRSATASSWNEPRTTTSPSPVTDGSWRSCPSAAATVGSRATR